MEAVLAALELSLSTDEVESVLSTLDFRRKGREGSR